MELVFERRKSIPDLRGPGQRGAPEEERLVRRARGELAAGSPLPGHRIGADTKVHVLQLMPQPQVLHDRVYGELSDDVLHPRCA
jgi:hypothetical protein